jgi:hypothetical protein
VKAGKTLQELVGGNGMNFYWTDSITGKGTLVYAEEEKAESILRKYFEASVAPLPGVNYPKTAVPWAGTIIPKWITAGVGSSHIEEMA